MTFAIERNQVINDPYYSYQNYLQLINAPSAWQRATGEGIFVSIIDDGFDYEHEDLTENYRTDLDYDFYGNDLDARALYDNDHGTAVAGIIAADNNDTGIIGIAHDADIIGYRVSFGNSPLSIFTNALNQAAADSDVVNNSWSFTYPMGDNYKDSSFNSFAAALENLVANGRGGLGTSNVFAAGNAREEGDNINYHNTKNSPFTISVASTQDNDQISYYSTPGAAVLVSAPGYTVYTTDRTGADGYTSGDYIYFGGTSAAAPVVSGVIALMLEANPDLGYRDVQQILAYTARHNDPTDASWQYNGAGNWNGGGLHFSHDYGYGVVNANAAVKLAESWSVQQTFYNMDRFSVGKTANIAIPDRGQITDSLNVSEVLQVEHVLIDLQLSHSKSGDLRITLISPEGTESVLVDRISNGSYSGSIDFEFSSVAHWGEISAGQWTLKVEDLAFGRTGTLNSWSLEFLGHQTSDGIYVYTDEILNFDPSLDPERFTLDDTDGGYDILNFAAMNDQSSQLIDLTLRQIVVSGKTIEISEETRIESVIAGGKGATVIGTDLEESITGVGASDALHGRGGNDVLRSLAGRDELYGQGGNDMMYALSQTHTADGGEGFDTLHIEGMLEDYVHYQYPDSTVFYLGNTSAPPVSVIDIEVMIFADGQSRSVQHYDLWSSYIYWIAGTDEADNILYGSDLSEAVIGFAGNDVIKAKDGDDFIDGGEGDDLLRGEAGNDIIYGGAGKDELRGEEGDDELHGGLERDILKGYTGRDTMYGDEGDDSLYGFEDEDLMYGGDGDDKIFGMEDDDEIHGGAGNDKIYGGYASSDIYASNDLIYGDEGYDTIYARKGDDTVYGGDGNDIIIGEEGNDELHGDAGNDILKGDEGDDLLFGGDGNDIIKGREDNDTAYGGSGVDVILGESGDDELYGDEGDDRLYGGNGYDTLYGDDDNDLLVGQGNHDTLYGGSGNDSLYGDENGATYKGNDALYGNEGNDLLVGHGGSDILNGGAGLDTMYGGGDADKFVFGIDAFDGNRDIIRDFDAGEGDTIVCMDDILVGYDALLDDLLDYFFLEMQDTGISLAVDRDGTAGAYSAQQILIAETSFDLDYSDIYLGDKVVV